MNKILAFLILVFVICSSINAQDTLTTPHAGIKYLVLQKGSGLKAEKNKRVVIHWEGVFANGKKLFSSWDDNGGPFEFILGRDPMLPYLEEGILLMKIGDKFRFIIPSNPIEPSIRYDIELLDIKDLVPEDLVRKDSLSSEYPIRCNLHRYEFNYDQYTILVPVTDTKTKKYFPLICNHPLTAYLFAEKMNEDKIRELTVRQLKTGTFSGYSTDAFVPLESIAYSMFFIEGFEKYYEELRTIDEFELAERKEEFLNKLIECWKDYDYEFTKLSNHNLYVDIGFNIEYEIEGNEFKLLADINSKNNVREERYATDYFKVSKDNYDFDKQEMTFPFPLLVKSSGYGINVWNWNRNISSSLTDEILTNASKEHYTESIYPELAKKLIDENASGKSILILNLQRGFTSYYGHGGTKYLQNFNISSIEFIYALNGHWAEPIYKRTFQN